MVIAANLGGDVTNAGVIGRPTDFVGKTAPIKIANSKIWAAR